MSNLRSTTTPTPALAANVAEFLLGAVMQAEERRRGPALRPAGGADAEILIACNRIAFQALGLPADEEERERFTCELARRLDQRSHAARAIPEPDAYEDLELEEDELVAAAPPRG